MKNFDMFENLQKKDLFDSSCCRAVIFMPSYFKHLKFQYFIFFAKGQNQKFSRSSQKCAKYQNFIQRKIYPRKIPRKKLEYSRLINE